MAANASSTRSLALVGAKLTTCLQNIRRPAAKAAPHRQQTIAGEAHESRNGLRRDIVLPLTVNKNLGVCDVCLDKNENLELARRLRLPCNRFSPHDPRAALLQHDARAQRDDLAAKARTIIAWQFVGLAGVDALAEIATRPRRGRRLRICWTCECNQTKRHRKRCTHTEAPGSSILVRDGSELGPATSMMPHCAAWRVIHTHDCRTITCEPGAIPAPWLNARFRRAWHAGGSSARRVDLIHLDVGGRTSASRPAAARRRSALCGRTPLR